MSANVFLDSQFQQIFDKEGIVQCPLLNNSEIASLLDLYQNTSANISEREFHSTMFINDLNYRAKIDLALKQAIVSKINAVVKGYKMLFANFIVKKPSIETRVGIHQDWNFTSPEYTSINVWIPLVDINEETGLFYALKGSHHVFKNIRYTPFEDNLYAELETFILENSVPFRVKAGNAIFYHGALVHFSDPNLSSSLRVAVGGVLLPHNAPTLHYYKPQGSKQIEVFEVDELFYRSFNFFERPQGVAKIYELNSYSGLPAIVDLNENVKLLTTAGPEEL